MDQVGSGVVIEVPSTQFFRPSSIAKAARSRGTIALRPWVRMGRLACRTQAISDIATADPM